MEGAGYWYTIPQYPSTKFKCTLYTVHCMYRAHVLSLLKLESYAGHQNGGQKGRWTEGMHDKMDAGE